MVMPRSRSSGALSMVSKARYSAPPLQAEVLGDGRGERRLAVVDVPDGAHVDVGLGALELLLGHRGCLTTPVQGFASRLGLGMEPTLGFEPKTSSLPRKCSAAELCGPGGHDRIKGVVGREGIEPPQSKTADLQSAELTTCSTYPRTALTLRDALPRGEENDLRSSSSVGADDGTRTRNRRFTKPLLYQLSYVGGDVEGYRTHAKACNDIPGPLLRLGPRST